MDKEQFLKELSELSMKYGIAIGGCGCCGSPYLTEKTFVDINRMDEPVKKGHYELENGDTLAWHEE